MHRPKRTDCQRGSTYPTNQPETGAHCAAHRVEPWKGKPQQTGGPRNADTNTATKRSTRRKHHQQLGRPCHGAFPWRAHKVGGCTPCGHPTRRGVPATRVATGLGLAHCMWGNRHHAEKWNPRTGGQVHAARAGARVRKCGAPTTRAGAAWHGSHTRRDKRDSSGQESKVGQRGRGRGNKDGVESWDEGAAAEEGTCKWEAVTT